jgi:hypothetical protein
MSPDFSEIGFAGAGFVDELTVKHYNQAVGQFEQFVKIFDAHPRSIDACPRSVAQRF